MFPKNFKNSSIFLYDFLSFIHIKYIVVILSTLLLYGSIWRHKIATILNGQEIFKFCDKIAVMFKKGNFYFYCPIKMRYFLLRKFDFCRVTKAPLIWSYKFFLFFSLVCISVLFIHTVKVKMIKSDW